MTYVPVQFLPLKGWHTLKRTYTFGVPTFYSSFHLGVDYIVPIGTPIYAPYDGEVKTLSGPEGGNTVHFVGQGYLIRFLHLSKFTKIGKVKAGEIIGYSGNSGVTTGPHCHIDVSVGTLKLNDRSNFVDPDKFFMLTLKVHVVAIDSPWVDQKVPLDLTPYVRFEYSYSKISGVRPKWFRKRVEMNWWRQNVAPYGSGADIVVLTMPPALWEATDVAGFCLDTWLFGQKPIFMKAEKDGVRRGGDEFTGRMAHELCHAMFDFTNAFGMDNVHEWDYEKNDVKGSLHDKVTMDSYNNKRKNWLFKYKIPTTREAPFSGIPKPMWVYRTSDDRMFFRYSIGWEIINVEEFDKGQNKTIISDAEGNGIYALLGKTPPSYGSKTVLGVQTDNLARRTMLKALGWSEDIPKTHLFS